MANNQYVNKVIKGNDVLIDLTQDDVSASDVLSGKKFHLPSGAQSEGTCSYDADTSDGTAVASEILNTKTAYVGGQKITGSMPNRGQVTGSIATKTGVYTIPNGYHDGSGLVQIDATEQAKLIASNILQGVTILGVQGNVQPASDIQIEASKTVTPTFSSQTILPSTGYDAMAQLIINAIPYTEVDNAAGGKTVTFG